MKHVAVCALSIIAAIAGVASTAAPSAWAAVDQAIGRKGAEQPGGVYKYSFPRSVAISINFEPTGAGKAAVTGDFVLVGSEVNPVLKTLRDNGIEVTALHSHMIDDTPHLYFMHFWANADAQKLAQGLRAALDHVSIARER